jgi:hypothetical protein
MVAEPSSDMAVGLSSDQRTHQVSSLNPHQSRSWWGFFCSRSVQPELTPEKPQEGAGEVGEIPPGKRQKATRSRRTSLGRHSGEPRQIQSVRPAELSADTPVARPSSSWTCLASNCASLNPHCSLRWGFFCSRPVQEQRPCADGRTILRYLAQQVVTPYKVHVIAKTLASTS